MSNQFQNPMQVPQQAPQQVVMPQQAQVQVPQQAPQQVVVPQQAQVQVPQQAPQQVVMPQQAQVQVPQQAPQQVVMPQQAQMQVPQQAPQQVVMPQQAQVQAPQQAPQQVAIPQQAKVQAPQQAPRQVVMPQQTQVKVPQQAPQQVAIQYADRPNTQILRKDGNGVFFELLLDYVGIDKLGLGFSSYDKNATAGSRQKHYILFYLDMFHAAMIANDILSGRYSAIAQQNKANPAITYQPPVFDIKRGSVYGNQAVSRVLSLVPGDRKPWLLKAEQGAGNRQKSGIIAPAFGRNPDASVRVPLTDEDLKEFALAINHAVLLWSNHRFAPAVEFAFTEAERKASEKTSSSKK